MQRRAARLFLVDIESAIERISSYTAGGETEFKSSEVLQDAVLRQFMVIGEAVQNLPEDLLDREPTIPWATIVGLRNRIVHGYFKINMDLIWAAVASDLPELREATHRLLEVVDLEGDD